MHTSIANTSDRLHWVYIANNFIIIVIAIVAFKVCRHHSPDPDEIQEGAPVEARRPPPHGSALAVFVGTGTQLFFTTAFTLFFAVLGFLSPANPGGLLTTLILLFVILSFVGGNVCARILKLFELKSWIPIFVYAFTFPEITFIVYVLINLVNWNVGASTAISFSTLLTLLGLWIAAGIPLTILGASLGFRQSTIEYRVTTPEVDRESTVKWFWRPFIYIFPAFFPFCVVFLELRLILHAIWLGMSYYVFGFLVLVFVEWTIAVSLTTIIVLYCQSCFEDHRWWWQSVVISGALGIVVFAYSVYYYFTALSITGATGTFLYFTYMAMVSAAFGLAAGAVGFLAAFYFARKINGSKKSESKPELQKAGGDAYDVTELVCWNVCAHIRKPSDLMSWKFIFVCAFTFPGITFIVYVLINLVNWNVGASTAISFDTMLTLLALWIAAGIPLTIFCASLGFCQSTIEYRVTTAEVDREWTVKWFWRPFIFPFCVLCLELRLILDAIWLGMSYYVFGFLVLVFVEWTIAVSLTTIIVLCCQSCFEDHRWWWQSVVISGALGIVVFAYSLYYFFTGATRTFLYFSYSAMSSAAFGVGAGAVGFLAAFFFARKINGSKKSGSKPEWPKAGWDVTEPPIPPVILGVVVDEEGAEIKKVG